MMERSFMWKRNLRWFGLGVFAWLVLSALCVYAQSPAGETELNDSSERAIRPEVRARIERHQREVDEGKYSFAVGYNPAMEYSLERLCGLKEPENWRANALFARMEPRLTTLPSSFDWRKNGGTTPIKNQGACGSCWAFGTVAPLESQIQLQCDVTEDLSEQFLVSCNRDGYSCSGGWWAHDYHDWKVSLDGGEPGAVRESSFPYKASNLSCAGPYSHPYKIAAWSYVGGYNVPSVEDIKTAIYEHGPVAAAVCVGGKFQSYTGGIFNYNESCSGTINHAIALVGWEDDLGPNNGYWILRNSWGSGWGESGYMRIRYNTSMVGYAANYVELAQCSSGSSLSCSDPIGLSFAVPYTGNTISGPSKVSRYGTVAWDETGPEIVHRIVTTGYGNITATLSNLSADLDVFLLNACSPNSLVAYGDSTASYANAPPGTYYVVVDGRSGGAGAYTLTVAQSCPIPAAPGSISYPSSDIDGNFRVSWSSVSGAKRYTLQRAADAYFQPATTVYAGALNYFDQKSLGAGTYYYRVLATNDCNNVSAWKTGGAVAVTVPSIKVTSPNDGGIWTMGAKLRISWTYTSNAGADVKIDLLKAGVYKRTIQYSKGSGSSGYYYWTLPTSLTAGSDYKVRVTSRTNSAWTDVSDNVFSIVK